MAKTKTAYYVAKNPDFERKKRQYMRLAKANGGPDGDLLAEDFEDTIKEIIDLLKRGLSSRLTIDSSEDRLKATLAGKTMTVTVTFLSRYCNAIGTALTPTSVVSRIIGQ